MKPFLIRLAAGLSTATLLLAACSRETPEQRLERKARKLHASILNLDSHVDTPLNLSRKGWKIGERHDWDQPGGGRLDLPRLEEAGLDAVFFAAFISQGRTDPAGFRGARLKADELIRLIRFVAIEHPEKVRIAFTPQDVEECMKMKKAAILIGLENGYPLGEDISLLSHYHQRGVRYVTLCHTENNQICDSSTDPGKPRWQGLSPFGYQVVQVMNRLGMLIDLSHVSDSTFYDVLKTTRTPVIASHSCCRGVYDHPRNLSDDMLLALARKGGVVQINLCSFYLKETAENPEREAALKALRARYGRYMSITDDLKREQYLTRYEKINRQFPEDLASVEDLVNHIDHAVRVAGIDHVGIGSDFDGGAELSDCRDVSQMHRITLELMKRGYKNSAIRKIWGDNFMRVFREVQDYPQKVQKAALPQDDPKRKNP
ncbi:dipeptidase [bacterium]|nr:dipeptidase [bacterium]